jgi:hypothetical protein
MRRLRRARFDVPDFPQAPGDEIHRAGEAPVWMEQDRFDAVDLALDGREQDRERLQIAGVLVGQRGRGAVERDRLDHGVHERSARP